MKTVDESCWSTHIEHQELGTSVCTLQRKSERISSVDGGLTMQSFYVPTDKETSEPDFKHLGA